MRRGTANTNGHDANKHGPEDEREQTHARTNNGLHTRERGDAREERRGGEDAAC
jgi:hypothetical protein